MFLIQVKFLLIVSVILLLQNFQMLSLESIFTVSWTSYLNAQLGRTGDGGEENE